MTLRLVAYSAIRFFLLSVQSREDMIREDMIIVKPCEALRPYVRYYWALKSRATSSVLTFPTGCPQIIFHRRRPLYIPELDIFQHSFTISGQVNFPAHLVASGDTEMIVAVFYPHTCGVFTGIPPSDFYNSEISGFDIDDTCLSAIAVRILDCESITKSISVLESGLLSVVARLGDASDLRKVGLAVGRIMERPSMSVARLADCVCLSTKQFGRIFNRYVGMMPKEYARVVRFQKSMQMLQEGYNDFAGITYGCGYSDQSHFIRDFRRYSGVTPSAIDNPYSDLYTTPA